MSDGLALFPATNAWLERIRELHLAGLRDTGALSLDPQLDADLVDIERAYADGAFLLAAWSDAPRHVVGMGALARVGDGWQVKRMRVDSTHRRRGVGDALLVALLARARELGIGELTLDTAHTQAAAQRLYERHGFAATGDIVVGGVASRLYRQALDAGAPTPAPVKAS